MRKNIFLFMGPPGSGKGSLSKLCIKAFGWHQFSTGNACRQHIVEQTSIGQQIDFAIKSGKLVSDGLVTAMVDVWLSEAIHDRAAGIILDGFPRTVVQAQAFESLLEENFKTVDLSIVKLRVPDEYIVARLAERYMCQNEKCQAVYSMVDGSALQPKKPFSCDECESVLVRRSDDTKESVLERLKAYYFHEKALLDFYQAKGQPIQELDGRHSLIVVFENFKRLIGGHWIDDYDKK
jgi:adenylate kinase